jgi:molybdopterin converting factor small subunit
VKIEVRLFANLAAHLPSGTRGDAATLDVPDAATVADVIRRLQIPEELPRLVLVNGREADSDAALVAGDVVTLYPPLAGG